MRPHERIFRWLFHCFPLVCKFPNQEKKHWLRVALDLSDKDWTWSAHRGLLGFVTVEPPDPVTLTFSLQYILVNLASHDEHLYKAWWSSDEIQWSYGNSEKRLPEWKGQIKWLTDGVKRMEGCMVGNNGWTEMLQLYCKVIYLVEISFSIYSEFS